MPSVGESCKCEPCGTVVEVKEAVDGELVCCGEPMKDDFQGKCLDERRSRGIVRRIIPLWAIQVVG